MKKSIFWIQLALVLVAVFSILAILQGVLTAQRNQAAARATEVCIAVELDPVLVQQGQQIYQTHCTACHGAGLEGNPAWETPLEDGSNLPPPLNSSAHAWQHSDSSITRTITAGRNAGKQSFMPAFGATLTEQEISAVIEFIKSTWGEQEQSNQEKMNTGG